MLSQNSVAGKRTQREGRMRVLPSLRSVIVLLALCVAACSRAQQNVRAGQYSGAPVILISIDTLRADRLPLFGYAAGSTPVLDRLGRLRNACLQNAKVECETC